MQSPIAKLVSGLAFVVAIESAVSAQISPIAQTDHGLRVDSGWLDNTSSQERVLFTHVVRYPGSPWLRVFFDQTNLPQGSFLRITSLKDGDFQTLNGRTLVEYFNASCFLNGEAVRVELVGGPRTSANRVLIIKTTAGVGPAESICGSRDDRVQSFDKRQGRLSVGCTGWLFSRSAMGTAGHCMNNPNQILEFNVPNSTSSGGLVRSAVRDQYPTRGTTLRRLNAGVGQDWATCRIGRNSQTNLLPGDAQGGWYDIGPVPTSTTGQRIRITGYGTSSVRRLNQVQKTHVGPLAQLGGNFLRYATDTTGGNSGSPVIHANTNKVIGVHTHGGCTSGGGANSGTRVDRADFQLGIKSLIGRAGTVTYYGAGCRGTGGVPNHTIVGVPEITRTITFRTENLPASAGGFLIIGSRRENLDLSPFGFAGCRLLARTSVLLPLRSNASGVAASRVSIPNCTILVGSVFVSQQAGIDSSRNSVTFSNGAETMIGYR